MKQVTLKDGESIFLVLAEDKTVEDLLRWRNCDDEPPTETGSYLCCFCGHELQNELERAIRERAPLYHVIHFKKTVRKSLWMSKPYPPNFWRPIGPPPAT